MVGAKRLSGKLELDASLVFYIVFGWASCLCLFYWTVSLLYLVIIISRFPLGLQRSWLAFQEPVGALPLNRD